MVGCVENCSLAVEPSRKALIVAVPVVVGAVSVAVYVPSPTFVTAPRLPKLVVIVTAPPLAPRVEPPLFLSVTVIVEVVVPPEASAKIVVGPATTVDWLSDAVAVFVDVCAVNEARRLPALSWTLFEPG